MAGNTNQQILEELGKKYVVCIWYGSENLMGIEGWNSRVVFDKDGGRSDLVATNPTLTQSLNRLIEMINEDPIKYLGEHFT